MDEGEHTAWKCGEGERRKQQIATIDTFTDGFCMYI